MNKMRNRKFHFFIKQRSTKRMFWNGKYFSFKNLHYFRVLRYFYHTYYRSIAMEVEMIQNAKKRHSERGMRPNRIT